jgi:restriction system protein
MARKVPIERVGELLHTVLSELKRMGGEMKLKDLLNAVEPKLKLNEYELGTYPKSGYVRWRSIVHFYSIDCVKAGYITKAGGRWTLTQAGDEALKQRPGEFILGAIKKYREWKSTRPDPEPENSQEPAEVPDEAIVRQTAYEQAVEQSRAEIENHIDSLAPYDFQKLVAELLVGMGYFVPLIAAPGPDGGVDIIAYRDPLGASVPRIKVQVKHREQKVDVKDVRQFQSVLRNDADIGLIVSSSGFTSTAQTEVRLSPKHIEMIDLERLIELWEQHYDKIRESGKALLPLVKLSFLAPAEER